ncbi:DUF4238 domain-containing protein [Cyanobium sp. N.Huapi 1H5]|nr:DUF4238 domain-containing protein [Cyanobium sp. N.Huapi 1H5]
MLKSFSPRPGTDQVFVYDKKTEKRYKTAVVNAASERDFNSVRIGEQTVNYEILFQEADNRLAIAIQELSCRRSLLQVDEQVVDDLAALVATQLVRTKIMRTSPMELSNQLSDWLDAQGLDRSQVIDDAAARKIAFAKLFELDQIVKLLRKKNIVLLVSETGGLCISDNPVVMNNSFPYGRIGLDAPGIEIYFPVSPHISLALYCPSIHEILSEAINANHPRPAPKEEFSYRLNNSLELGEPLVIDDRYCMALNELQVLQSSRFLYSSNEDFGFASAVTGRSHKAREVRSLYSIGNSPVPPAPGLPNGDWLVLEQGHCHYCLSITWLNPESVYIEFQTTELAKLDQITDSQPFESATLYRNGRGVRGMGDVVIVNTMIGPEKAFRVEHSDHALNELLRQTGENPIA